MSPFAEELMGQLHKAPNLRLTAIVEMARVPLPARQRLIERFAQTAYPILYQQCFANLRDIGPWLFSSGEHLSLDSQYDFHCTLVEIAGDVPCAWLVSALEPSRLANHLGQAATARGPDGASFLLRFYSEQAFPMLQARHDLPGIAELLAPIHSWWALEPHDERNAWRHYEGHNRPDHYGIPPIRLDQACWDALTGSPLRFQLCDLLQQERTPGKTENGHAIRLARVQQLLAEARQCGLHRPADQKDYVIFLTRHGSDLRTNAAWQAALTDARDDAKPLAQALKQRLFQHS
ncbi:DUF4123 domain-containing protein [Pseudomonas sp. 5P_5.1_Bac1]|uniref:DUF4123 domain-containing protein n=1 Tax=Pseudomonas sp. 5P_5.1_Bac1 TaxID=2971616 RepID=UPI0021C9EE64|nr:DUF4123 domain-containing protein [Pseudomonas sp. 5P_5.1_Bac1]MCU1720353.1 DUF4123 domain-containing protein [Pseudomonas sp. 5P_5.1_Bac1]